MCQEHSQKKKERTPQEYRRLLNRLSRIEGQVRGIRRMVEEDVYCVDILSQTAAVGAALSAFSRELLTQHLLTCVAEDLRAGRDEKAKELAAALQKLLR